MNERLEYVKKQISESVMITVAFESGVSVRTLSNIKNGITPRDATLKVLHRYFKRRDGK